MTPIVGVKQGTASGNGGTSRAGERTRSAIAAKMVPRSPRHGGPLPAFHRSKPGRSTPGTGPRGLEHVGIFTTKRTLTDDPGARAEPAEDAMGFGVSGGHGATGAFRGGRGGSCFGIVLHRGLRGGRARPGPRRRLAPRGPRGPARDVPAGAWLRPVVRRRAGALAGVERVHAGLPAPDLLRRPDDRAGEPGAPAQPAGRPLPRPGAGVRPGPSRLRVGGRRPADRPLRRGGRHDRPADPLAAALPAGRGRAHRLRGRRDRRPASVATASWCWPGATSASASGRPCCAGWSTPSTCTATSPASGSRGCRRPTSARPSCSTSSHDPNQPIPPPGGCRSPAPLRGRGSCCPRTTVGAPPRRLGACAVATPPADAPRTSSRSSRSPTPASPRPWSPTTTSRRPRRSTPSSSGPQA